MATLEYTSNAPDPIITDRPQEPAFPRLSKHYLLPDNTPDYLRLILNAKVYDILQETPLIPATNLSTKLGNSIFLKREDLHEVFSFKIRGAYNFMAHLTDEERWKGVVTCSAGQCACLILSIAKFLIFLSLYRKSCPRCRSLRCPFRYPMYHRHAQGHPLH